MPALAAWYDLRDLGHYARSLLGWLSDDLGAPDWVTYVASGVIGVVAILLWLLVSQLSFIWIERRIIARMQARIWPNRVGPRGLLQPIADALKLLLKEAITNRLADRALFWRGLILVFVPAMGVF